MRTYYRHARIIYRRAALLMEHLPAPVSFYNQFRRRRTPIAGTDFLLDQGRIDILPGAQFNDTGAILRIFSLMATHGYALSQAAEDRITDALPALAIHIPEGPYLWNALREVLLGPHAAHALRTMHALGVLEMLIPEFHGIDALVIRDSYHRYTVDEHTFLTIDNVHGLRQPAHDYEHRLAQLLPEIDRLDLFLLSLLLHDTGKARRTGEHASQSVELADAFLARLDFDAEEREPSSSSSACIWKCPTPCAATFSIRKTCAPSAEKIGSPQLLKMLTLMTYADIKAVNPEALTPWKAENLWQFYMSTANFMDRCVDEVRYHAAIDPTLLNRIRSMVPSGAIRRRSSISLKACPSATCKPAFPSTSATTFQLAANLDKDPVQLDLRPHRQLFDLTVITRDRTPPLRRRCRHPGRLGNEHRQGWRLLKRGRSHRRQLPVHRRFSHSRAESQRKGPLSRIPSRRRGAGSSRRAVARSAPPHEHPGNVKVEVATRLEFDSESSTHSTLLQVVAQDVPGLLRQIALTLSTTNATLRLR